MTKQERNKVMQVFSKLIKNAKTSERICQYPKCSNNAINSHLMQQNGMLSHLVKDGHLIQISPNDLFKIEKEGQIIFKKIGIKQAISYPLYCNTHDTELFSFIENNDDDNFFYYKGQLLFSYRSVCAELRKKEQNIDISLATINSGTLGGILENNFFKAEQISLEGNRMGQADLIFYKEELEKELESPENVFTFKTLKFPPIKICVSAVFSYVDSRMKIIERYLNSDALNAVVINAIPRKDSLYVIVGYHNSKADGWVLEYVDKWAKCDKTNLSLMLSDLASRVESWAMAEDTFQKISAETLAKFKEHFLKSFESGIDYHDISTIDIFSQFN